MEKDECVGYFPESNGKFPICEYSFDYETGIFHELLKELKLVEKIHCEKKLPYLNYIFSDEKLTCEYSWDGFKKLIIERFGEEQEALKKFFSLIEKLSEEWICMVNSYGLPSFTKIMNMAKYSNVKYLDYIHNNFKDLKLIQILVHDVVNKDISLTVMAGYIMQLFNGRRLVGGYKELENHLYSVLYDFAEVVEATSANVKYEYCSQEQDFKVMVGENNYKSNILVMSSDTLGVFESGKYEVSERHIVHVNCITNKKNNRNESIYKYCGYVGGKDNNKTDYYCVITEIEDKVQARLFISDTEQIDMNLILEDVIAHVTNLCGSVISCKLADEADINDYFQWNCGQINAWGFSVSDFKDNPLTRKFNPPGLYLTGVWGRAFITSAKVTSKNIIMSGKEF